MQCSKCHIGVALRSGEGMKPKTNASLKQCLHVSATHAHICCCGCVSLCVLAAVGLLRIIFVAAQGLAG